MVERFGDLVFDTVITLHRAVPGDECGRGAVSPRWAPKLGGAEGSKCWPVKVIDRFGGA